MMAAAVRQNHNTLGFDELQRVPDAFRNDVGRLDAMALDVDHANTQLEGIGELSKHIQVLPAAPRKLQSELMNVRFKDCRKQVTIVSGPRRFSITIAVANVQSDPGVHSIHQRVQYLYAPGQILREAGIVRLIDL